MVGHVTSHYKDEEDKTRVALATRPTTQGSSSLCPRCSGIFLDPNTCRSLIETGRQSPYRIDHYTISELKKYADHGCGLCSVLSRASQREDDENMGSFFEICPTPATGLRSEIVWTVGRNNRYGQPVHQLSFYFFAVPESPISTMIPSRTIFSSVTNERAIRRIERAITQCLMQHEGCPRSKVNPLPSRVIDVEKMCLHETEGRETDTYAALSYCWGGNHRVKTTRANIPSKKKGIALEGLPQTLQDAVQVCRQLTIRYLWIDALCIIQDDESDKAREISQMALIYNRATLVIAASRAKSVYDGFLADIEVHPEGAIMLPARFSKTWEGEIGILKVPMESSGQEPLNQRGWAYQEISLASRALIYTEGGIIWQCNTIFDRLAFDGIQMGSHPSEDLVVATKEFEAGTLQRVEWDQLVRIYTLRSLTYPDDRLEALAGIATIAAPLWNSKYYAGLWEQDMESQLGWRLDDSAVLYDWKWRKPQAPSWSWASVDGPVCNVVQFVRSETPRGARVISCEVTLTFPENSFGRVLSGRLTIEAFLVQARQADPSWLADTCMDSNAKSVKEEDLDDIWCLLLGCAPDNGMEADEFPQWDGLLLSCLPDGTFKRLGHFRQDLDRENWMDDEVSFDEYYSGLEDEQLLGPEARFPVGGSRRTVVIV